MIAHLVADEKPRTPQALGQSIRKKGEEALVAVPGIGRVVAASVSSWFQDPEHEKLLKNLTEAGIQLRFTVTEKASNVRLVGKIFVLTGELDSFTRDEAKDMIKKQGGKVASSVSRKTDFVIVGSNPGSKLDDAKRLGVPFKDEAAFKEILTR